MNTNTEEKTKMRPFVSISEVATLIDCNKRKAGQIIREVKDKYPEATVLSLPRLIRLSCVCDYLGINEKETAIIWDKASRANN